MEAKTFGETLRTLRERKRMTVKMVIEELKKYGQDITDKTLYSYENDKRAASADMLLALCQIYNCNNILEVFAGIKPDYSIPDDSEWKLIEKYRSLDTFGRETISYILDRELARTNQLENVSSAPVAMRIYTYVNKIACAGNGFFFEDIPTDQIEAPEVPGADFIIGVSGDSMKPTFLDGDKLYVQKTPIVETGEIGIFLINNECFVKEAGENGLISHNPKYDINPGNENIICIGKVLGKISTL